MRRVAYEQRVRQRRDPVRRPHRVLDDGRHLSGSSRAVTPPVRRGAARLDISSIQSVRSCANITVVSSGRPAGEHPFMRVLLLERLREQIVEQE
jgi:hypothetical protein